MTSHRILAVDDLSDNILLLQTILEAEGYEVAIASSGQSALEQMGNAPPDLVLLDVMMPEMSGYEVVQQMRQHERFSLIPVLMVTAHCRTVASQALEVGANGCISKPIDFDELLSQVRSALQSFHS